ncbi:hypothetical protein BH20BAC1_BH20BAC1_23050 [soil metagenome]
MVHVSQSFAIRPLIKAYSRSESYLVMLLSQGRVKLYEAVNDGIIPEIKNEDFPFPEKISEVLFPVRRSDSEYMDDLVREYFNKIDKALVNVYNETDLNCVVDVPLTIIAGLCRWLINPNVYQGYVNIDYNNVVPHQIVQQTWELVENQQKQRKTEAIEEIKEAVASGKVITDLQGNLPGSY